MADWVITEYDADNRSEGELPNRSPDNPPSDAHRTEVFYYDALGNRMNGAGAAPIYRRNNGLNQYESWNAATFVNYEANGVMTQEGWLSANYNALNQPVAVARPGLAAGTYTWFGYDPLGRCVKRWTSASGEAAANPAIYFYYDGWSLIQEGGSSAEVARTYVHGGRIDEVVASSTAPATGQWYYHHYDARGACLLLTDTTGALVEQYSYDAFGKPRFYTASGAPVAEGQALGNRFLFTGREWLADLKVYDYRNRLYHPELGRFLQPDPKQFEAGDYNLYRYCHNDPVNKTDPTGLDTYAIGPYISIGVGFHFNASLQVSLSTPYRLTDVANYRLGVIATLPAGGSSTGLGGSAGVAVTTSAANTPSELSGTSGTFGGSAGVAIVGGADVGNVGAKIGNTNAPTSLTRSVGIGIKISPAIAPAPAEVHAGAAKTFTTSVSLGEIRNQQLQGPEKLKLKEK